MIRLPDDMDGMEAARLLYGGEPDREPVARDEPDDRFSLYCERLSRWADLARSLPDADVEAALDALRLEARHRRYHCSDSERRAAP